MKKLLLIVYFLVTWREFKSVPVHLNGDMGSPIIYCEYGSFPHERRCVSQAQAEKFIADMRDEDYLDIEPTNRFDYKILKVEELK